MVSLNSTVSWGTMPMARRRLAWVTAAANFVVAVAAPVLGTIADAGGFRKRFLVILAVVGRASSDENRSIALGIATAAGSAGQVIGPPVAAGLLAVYPWQTVFLIFAAVILAALFVLPMMRAPKRASRAELEESMGAVLTRAFRDPSYTLIFLGFFSCGYQLAFITAHFPAFVTEMCGPIQPGGDAGKYAVAVLAGALAAVVDHEVHALPRGAPVAHHVAETDPFLDSASLTVGDDRIADRAPVDQFLGLDVTFTGPL